MRAIVLLYVTMHIFLSDRFWRNEIWILLWMDLVGIFNLLFLTGIANEFRWHRTLCWVKPQQCWRCYEWSIIVLEKVKNIIYLFILPFNCTQEGEYQRSQLTIMQLWSWLVSQLISIQYLRLIENFVNMGHLSTFRYKREFIQSVSQSIIHHKFLLLV